MIKRCISSIFALPMPWSLALWCAFLQDKWRLIHVIHAVSFSFPSLPSTLDLKASSSLAFDACGPVCCWHSWFYPSAGQGFASVCCFWLLKDSSAHLPSSSLIPIGGFVGVCSAWAVGGVVFVEPVLSHVWPWHSDPGQDLCAPPAWKQGLWRARGANQTLQYSCVPGLVLISISSSATILSFLLLNPTVCSVFTLLLHWV